MKGKTISAVALLMAAAQAPSTAAAQTRGGLEIGVEVFDYGYDEFDLGTRIVRDQGIFKGLNFGYVQRVGNGFFLRAMASGATGSVDYESDDGTRANNIRQKSGRVELNVGKDFELNGGTTLTAFAGFGGRLLEDDSGGQVASDGLVGYDREVDYDYVPLGLAAGLPVGGRTRLTISAQYDLIVGGSSEAKLSRLDPDLDDVKVDFNGGHGVEASAIMAIPVGGHAVNIGPFIRRWNLKESESVTIVNPDDPTESIKFTEPKNRTTELGLRLSFAF